MSSSSTISRIAALSAKIQRQAPLPAPPAIVYGSSILGLSTSSASSQSTLWLCARGGCPAAPLLAAPSTKIQRQAQFSDIEAFSLPLAAIAHDYSIRGSTAKTALSISCPILHPCGEAHAADVPQYPFWLFQAPRSAAGPVLRQ